MILLLSWRGPCLPTGQRERVELNAKDEMGYTALHYAALSGLKKCVEYLLAHGADPYIENKAGLSPCDLAMRENHHDIALVLESKMVFTGTPGKNLVKLGEQIWRIFIPLPSPLIHKALCPDPYALA